MKLLQVNTVVNSGSTGRIAEGIGEVAMQNGWESYIAFGRNPRPSKSKTIQLCKSWELYPNVLYTRIFDKDGAFSKLGTRRLISAIEEINPDIIHLHNLHGYYLHVPSLFDYLVKRNRPVVWTLHDCWIMTGHCCYFFDCRKWENHCSDCPRKKSYPASYLFDNSSQNHSVKIGFARRAETFLHLVPVSDWLRSELGKSHFKDCASTTIRNGIDLSSFKTQKDLDVIRAKHSLTAPKYAICVANVWGASKGYADLPKIANLLNKHNVKLIVVGTSKKQTDELKLHGIIPILRTENIDELAGLYSLASVFLNPTYSDNYPTVNMEAIACGTPVVTYDTGGSPESLDENTGAVVKVGDVRGMVNEAIKIVKRGKAACKDACLKRAKDNFSKELAFSKYINLYSEILKNA